MHLYLQEAQSGGKRKQELETRTLKGYIMSNTIKIVYQGQEKWRGKWLNIGNPKDSMNEAVSFIKWFQEKNEAWRGKSKRDLSVRLVKFVTTEEIIQYFDKLK